MIEIFSKDDNRYKQWLRSHPMGFVRNDNKVHEARCPALWRTPRGARPDNPFTKMYPKECADSEAELQSRLPAPRRCKKCFGRLLRLNLPTQPRASEPASCYD